MSEETRNKALGSECCSKVVQWETWNILGKLEQERKNGSCSWKLKETRCDQAIVLLNVIRDNRWQPELKRQKMASRISSGERGEH
jgi:hypothetical protein